MEEERPRDGHELAYYLEAPRGRTPWLPPLLFGGVLGFAASALGPTLMAPSFVMGTVAGWLYLRRVGHRPHRILRVERGKLSLLDGRRAVLFEAPLADLYDVTLDTKTIQKLMPDPHGAPHAALVNATVGPAMDNSRIELSFRDENLLLNEAFTSNIEATEWFSKIRRFLRGHGWEPVGERHEETAAPYR